MGKSKHWLDTSVDGLECARIEAEVTGAMEGEGQQGGANLYFEGDIESTETCCFAYKKGVFVKTTSKGMTDAPLAVTGPQKMTFPMTTQMPIEAKLVK